MTNQHPASAPDPALSTLLLPFVTGQVTWPEAGSALFLGARASAALRGIARSALVCEQSYKPAVDALTREGWPLCTAEEAEATRHSLVLVLPPRQRQEARALLAHAVACCAPGGTIVACMANDEGARSGESDLKSLAGLSGSLSKNHCRVYWSTVNEATCDAALLATWRDARCAAADSGWTFHQSPGCVRVGSHRSGFGAARRASAGHTGRQRGGSGLRLWISRSRTAATLPGSHTRSICTKPRHARWIWRGRISRRYADRASLNFHWHDVTRGLPGRYDVIVSNPPFHAQGAGDRPDIGRAFIAAAAEALRPGGRLWMVANRHLPYESVLDARFGTVRIVTQAGGFKIVEAVKAGGTRS